MPNVLIYYPPNKSSNVIETIAKSFVQKGHTVFLLTQAPEGDLHAKLNKAGIKTFSYVVSTKLSALFYIKHLVYLIRFCKKNNITLVESHLQQANIIAVFAGLFINSKVVAFRHHLTEPSKMSAVFDKLINRFAKLIVVPSGVIKEKLMTDEKVKPQKVQLIPYIYNFNEYPTASVEDVNRIKQQFKCHLLVLLCGRFVPLKRNDIAIKAIEQLVKEGYDVKLLALDEGPGLEQNKAYVSTHQLDDKVFFIGYVKNVVDYLAACDVLVHPSYAEASNNTVKEAALYSKNVIVCAGVGDFSDYIIHGQNGYLVNREEPLQEIIDNLKFIYHNGERETTGNNLRETVLKTFHLSEKIVEQHLNLISN